MGFLIQIAMIFAMPYFLWRGELATVVNVGVAAAAIAICRDKTDKEWVTKLWGDGNCDGTGSGGGSIWEI